MKLFDTFLLRSPLVPHGTPLSSPFKLFKNSPAIQEAIFLSSRDLYQRIWDVICDRITDVDKVSKIRLSLIKYLKRLSYRSTPFGISAGISVGLLGQSNDLALSPCSENQKIISLDMTVLCLVFARLIAIPEVQERVRWFPNNSIYKNGESYRYIEYRNCPERLYFLSSFRRTEILDQILNVSAQGIFKSDIFDLLSSQGFEKDEVNAFISTLIAEKVVISELEPHMSGYSYQNWLTCFLNSNRDIGNDFVVWLRSILNQLGKEEVSTRDFNPLEYEAVSKALREQGLEAENVFHVVLLKPLKQNRLSGRQFENIRTAFELTHRLNPKAKEDQQQALNVFVRQFEQRYEGMLVPLMRVLDPDVGIGYPPNSNIYRESNFVEGLEKQHTPHFAFNYESSFEIVLKKYCDCIRKGEDEIVFKAAEVDQIPERGVIGADTIATMISLVKGRSGQTELVHLGSEPTGISAAARFAHASEQVRSFCKDICEAEGAHHNKLNWIVAEIVFMPTGTGGNLVSKPNLRKYEIPIICQSNLESDKIIPLSDILVGVRNGQVYLVSESRNKGIVCKFSSMFSRKHCQLPLFRFFYDLRYQGTQPMLNWNWGILSKMPFLPRVRYENIILSRQKWKLSFDDYLTHTRQRKVSLHSYLAAYNIPLKFCLTEGNDFVLPMDMQLEDDRNLFLAELRRKRRITIVEDIFRQGDGQVLNGSSEGYTNEVILFWNNLQSCPLESIPEFKSTYASEKYFLPGDRWVYAEIYCGQHTADSILVNHVYPIIKQLEADAVIEPLSWFFVRYDNPYFHLRIRIRTSESNTSEVQRRISEGIRIIFNEGLAHDIKYPVYQRELHRYGDTNIENAEDMFCADSDFVMSIFNLYGLENLEALRWKIAILGVHYLLVDFDYALEERCRIMNQLKTMLFNEHQFSSSEKKWLRDKYKLERRAIESVLLEKDEEMLPSLSLFALRRERLTIICNKVMKLRSGGILNIGLESVLTSFVHMFLNRVFMNRPRIQETVVYDLLHMHYSGQLGRIKHYSVN